MKILVISLDNWGFNQYIVDDLKNKGVNVVHWNFNQWKYSYSNKFEKFYNFFLKTFFKVNLKQVHLGKIIGAKLNEIDLQDHILIIKPNRFDKKTLLKIKAKTNRLVSFFNDSISRSPGLKNTIENFDEVFSFENEDVDKFGLTKINNYIYSPISNLSHSYDYKVFNISSINKRNELFEAFANYFNKKQITNKLIAFSRKDNESLSSLGVNLVKKPLSITEMLAYVKNSKILLDIQRPKQQGLSFRVFEALCYSKKIITTNKDIVNYDFYNPNNICVVDDINKIDIPLSFFETGYEEINEVVIEKYHISNWTKQVFKL